MDDTTLRRQVEDELSAEPSFNAAGIGVAVHDGVVSLTGHVSSYAAFHEAGRAALRVKGVRGLANEMEVRLSDAHRRTDEDIALSAANVLSSNAHIPPNQVKVSVRQGHVILEGQVEWWYQGEMAASLVRNLIGVRSLTNNITLWRKPVNGSVRQQIENALRRTALSEPGRIHVETRGDHVLLRGSVRAWWERDEAERIAWSVPGVCHVDNTVAVTGGTAALRHSA